MTYLMTIKRLVTAIALASLMGIVLPVATAQAPPCFSFDGQIKTMQCPVSFRPSQVQYYSNAQSDFSQATDNGDRLPGGFFDQRTIDTLRAQNQSQNATAAPNQNQTVSPPATNITNLEIEAVRSGLNSARQSLEDNNITAVIDSINNADGALFAIIHEGRGPVAEELIKLSDVIDTTRQSVFSLDNERTLEGLNAADSQLLVITEMLPTATATATATEEPEPEPPSPFTQETPLNQNQTNSNTSSSFFGEQQAQASPANQTLDTGIFPEQQQLPANETLAPMPEPEPAPTIQAPEREPEPEPVEQQQEPIITVPLNQTQQELITIEELAGLNINKTTHEKTTITIVQGNKTTHREITTTEVPL